MRVKPATSLVGAPIPGQITLIDDDGHDAWIPLRQAKRVAAWIVAVADEMRAARRLEPRKRAKKARAR